MRTRLPVALLLCSAMALGGCAASVAPSPSSSPAATPSLTPVPGGPSATPAGSGVPATQTDTEWGRIWDELPASFPRYPGAEPTEIAEGPATATVAIDAAAKDVAAFMSNAMKQAGYSFESLEGPAEDGGYVMNAVGATDDCTAQLRIKPLGGSTVMTTMYSANCPFE